MASRNTFKLTTEEQKALVRQQVGTTEEDIRQALSIIRNWLNAQPHLPHVIDDGRLERMYICSKCRVEKVKKCLDAYYTFKNKFPKLLMNRDPLGDDLVNIYRHIKMFTIPHLTKECHRVAGLSGIDPDASTIDISIAIKAMLMAVDFVLSYDYSVGYIFLVDLKNVSAAHIVKMTVRDICSLEMIARKAYSKRVIHIHFLNATKVIDMLLAVVKPALPGKLRKRITIHLPESETLFEHVPKEFVPQEMGGTCGYLDDIRGSINNSLSELREWFLEEDKYVADESKRPSDSSYEYELFGVDGSFKKLQVD